MPRSEKKKRFFGDEYTETRDDKGNKTGESRERTGLFGNKYVEHREVPRPRPSSSFCHPRQPPRRKSLMLMATLTGLAAPVSVRVADSGSNCVRIRLRRSPAVASDPNGIRMATPHLRFCGSLRVHATYDVTASRPTGKVSHGLRAKIMIFALPSVREGVHRSCRVFGSTFFLISTTGCAAHAERGRYMQDTCRSQTPIRWLGLASACHFGAGHHHRWANCAGRSGIPKEGPQAG